MDEPLGVLRRIDELGRIVIPKGIRNRLRINEGDRVELILNNESDLIVRKYSSFQGVDESIKKLIASLEKEIGIPVLLCSSEEVIAVSNERYASLEGKDICDELRAALNERRNVTLLNQKAIKGYEPINCAIYPIAKNSELVGGLILINTTMLNEYQNKIVLIFRNIIMNILKLWYNAFGDLIENW